MKNSFIAIALVAFSTTGCAQLTPNEVIGGVVGGVVGNQIGGGTGKHVATGVGAVVGANIGRQLDQQRYGVGVPYGVYGHPQVIPTQPRGYPPGYRQPYVYGSGTPSGYSQGEYLCAQEQYIDGVYNPPAAQAHCLGRIERDVRHQQQYEQDAYQRGRRGY